MSIVVEGFHKTYGDTVAVAGLDLRAEPGEVWGLLGPNGAGKTTTLRALAGILVPTRGRLLIAGHDVATDPLPAKAALAYVPDDPQLFDRLTVWEHLRFSAAVYRVPAWQAPAQELLDRLELTPKRAALASELSRGMRQKLALACAFLHAPAAVLLDEPMTGLDPRGIRTMKDMIRDYAVTRRAALVVSSHLLSLVEDLVTHLLVMHRGRALTQGRIDELRGELTADGRKESLEDVFFRLTEADDAPGPPAKPAAEAGFPSAPSEGITTGDRAAPREGG